MRDTLSHNLRVLPPPILKNEQPLCVPEWWEIYFSHNLRVLRTTLVCPQVMGNTLFHNLRMLPSLIFTKATLVCFLTMGLLFLTRQDIVPLTVPCYVEAFS